MKMAKTITRQQQIYHACARVVGKHVYGNLYGVDRSILTSMQIVESAVVKAAITGNMHILDIMRRKFDYEKSPDNGGVSVIALIEESHIAIHTWPESSYATVDIYSCGAHTNPKKAFAYILECFKPKSYKQYYADRSS